MPYGLGGKLNEIKSENVNYCKNTFKHLVVCIKNCKHVRTTRNLLILFLFSLFRFQVLSHSEIDER